MYVNFILAKLVFLNASLFIGIWCKYQSQVRLHFTGFYNRKSSIPTWMGWMLCRVPTSASFLLMDRPSPSAPRILIPGTDSLASIFLLHMGDSFPHLEISLSFSCHFLTLSPHSCLWVVITSSVLHSKASPAPPTPLNSLHLLFYCLYLFTLCPIFSRVLSLLFHWKGHFVKCSL